MAISFELRYSWKSLDELGKYVNELLSHTEQHINLGSKTYQLIVSDVEPKKPRVGMMAYADGTNWDPGSGEGPYIFTSLGWIALT